VFNSFCRFQWTPPVTARTGSLRIRDRLRGAETCRRCGFWNFLKFETSVFSPFALVPEREAAFAATHYDEHIGMFRCLGGDDRICCTKYGAARPTWHYLNASRTDGLMPENEPVLITSGYPVIQPESSAGLSRQSPCLADEVKGLVPPSSRYYNFAYSALACLRTGILGSASFQRVRKS